MYHHLSSRSIAFSCPVNGSSWYVCHEPTGSHFVGCCRTDPCAKGCPDGNLEPASFPKDDHHRLSDQVCQVGRWYTCAETNPTFLGCCTSNPCQLGRCPRDHLRAGQLSQNAAQAAAFLPSDLDIVAIEGNSTEPTARLPPRDSKLRIIVGAVVGSVTFLLLVVGFVLYKVLRNRKRDKRPTGPKVPNWSDSDIPLPAPHVSFYATSGSSDIPAAIPMSSALPGFRSPPQNRPIEMVSAQEGEGANSTSSISPQLNRYSDTPCSPYVSETGRGDGTGFYWVTQDLITPLPCCLQAGFAGQQVERATGELEAEVPMGSEREMNRERPGTGRE